MKIFNIMMCRDLGGLQQVFLDYSIALNQEGYEVINIVSRNAAITKQLESAYLTLPNMTSWCYVSKFYLTALINKHKPDLIIVHGGRAINFATFLARVKCPPIIGVTHGYTYKRLEKCDHVIAITKKLKEYMLENGYNEDNIHYVPNTVRIINDFTLPTKPEKVIIGTMARLELNKGIQHLIHAANFLRKQKLSFEVRIAGDGPLLTHLQNIVEKLNLERYVKFLGWQDNKNHFFSDIDIFCCPSEHEPFGLVIIEAMAHSVPVLATDSEGPSEIIQHEHNGFLAKNRSPIDLANKIEYMIDNWQIVQKTTKHAYDDVQNIYNIEKLGVNLSNVFSRSITQKMR